MSKATFALAGTVDLAEMSESDVLSLVGGILDAAVSPDCRVSYYRVASEVVDTLDLAPKEFRDNFFETLVDRYSDDIRAEYDRRLNAEEEAAATPVKGQEQAK